jgi:hypothetical protein
MKIFLQDYLPDQQQLIFHVKSTPEEQAEDKEYSVMADFSQRILFHCRPMQLGLHDKRSHYIISNCQTEMMSLLLMNVQALCKKHKIKIENLQKFVDQTRLPEVPIDQWPSDIQLYLTQFLDKKDKGSLMVANTAMHLARSAPDASLRQHFPHIYESMQNQEAKQSDKTPDEIDKAYWRAQKKANADEYQNMSAEEKFLMKLCKSGDPIGFHRQFGLQEYGALLLARDVNHRYALQWAYQNQKYYFLASIYQTILKRLFKNDENDQLSYLGLQMTPLDWAVACRQPLETLERILHNNLNFYREHHVKHSKSPVLTAITHRYIEAIDLFQSVGMNVCQRYHLEISPFRVAFRLKNNFEMTYHLMTKRLINPTHQMFIDFYSDNAPIEYLTLCCNYMPVDETGVTLRAVIDNLNGLESWHDGKKDYAVLILLCEHPNVKNVTKVLTETTVEIHVENRSVQVNKSLFNVLHKEKKDIAAYLVKQIPELVSHQLFIALFQRAATLSALEFCCAHMSPSSCEWSLRVVIDALLVNPTSMRAEDKFSVIQLLCASSKIKNANNLLSESSDKNGRTMLFHALYHGNDKMAKFLIEKVPELKSGNDLYHLVIANFPIDKIKHFCEQVGLCVHNEKRVLQKDQQSALYYLLDEHFLATLNMQFPDRDTRGWGADPQILHYACARPEVVLTYLQGASLFAPYLAFVDRGDDRIRTTPQAFLEAFLRHTVSTWLEKAICASGDVLFPLHRCLVNLAKEKKQHSFFTRPKINFGIILLANMMIEYVKHQTPRLLDAIEEGMRVIETRRADRDFQAVYKAFEEMRKLVLSRMESTSSVSLKSSA